MAGGEVTEAFRLFCEHFDAPEGSRAFAEELVNGVHRHLGEIDVLIKRFSENWRLERMSAVDRNIIRLAAFELLYRPDIPAKVSLNEAVDLGKKFGSEESGSFVNGILDRIRLYLDTQSEGEALPAEDTGTGRMDGTQEDACGAGGSQ
jgi:N utilization substance protein B